MRLKREDSAGYLTNQAARLFVRELERQLTPHGLSPAYMPILFALSEEGPLTPTTLAIRAAVEQPTMTATLNRMLRDGLITREPHPDDRRSTLIALTPAAEAKLPAVEKVSRATNQLALAELEPAEREQLLSLLRRVLHTLEVRADRGPGEP
jgi:MarR family transcriptional regulator, transcriptional regulator for hemolysin